MFSTEITNERPFVVVKESNVSLLLITKSVHFLSESLLLMTMDVNAISGENTDASDTSGTLCAVFGFCAVRSDTSVQASRDNLPVRPSGLKWFKDPKRTRISFASRRKPEITHLEHCLNSSVCVNSTKKNCFKTLIKTFTLNIG